MITSKALHLPGLAGLLLLLPAAACGQGQQQTTAGASTPVKAGLTLQDFTARRERRMLSADTDGDGKVSRSEFVASATAGKGDPAGRFSRLDRNADGALDRQEIASLMARRFGRLDADGDGVLTPAERMAAKKKPGRDDSGS